MLLDYSLCFSVTTAASTNLPTVLTYTEASYVTFSAAKGSCVSLFPCSYKLSSSWFVEAISPLLFLSVFTEASSFTNDETTDAYFSSYVTTYASIVSLSFKQDSNSRMITIF